MRRTWLFQVRAGEQDMESGTGFLLYLDKLQRDGGGGGITNTFLTFSGGL
jgi:hypothetical protein